MIKPSNRPWPIIQSHLAQKYRIVGEIDLFEVDRCPQSILSILEKIYLPRYDIDQKILIYHYDTDYYLDSVGLTLHNLLKSIQYTGISPSVFIMITNHHGIDREISDFYKKNYYNHDLINDSIKIFSSSYQNLTCPQSVDMLDTKAAEIGLIEKKFICLNGAKRSHRVIFLCLMTQMNLLDQGIFTWHFDQPTITQEEIPSNLFHSPKQVFHCITPQPFTRVNDYFPSNPNLLGAYNQHHHFYQKNYQDQRIHSGANQQRWCLPAIKRAFLYVSIETVFQYPYPYFTEKIFTPILNKRPFVVVGPPGILSHLNKLGFRTFGDFWDESYDSILDPSVRMEKVAGIVELISKLSVEEIKDLCYHMEEILIFNYNHYVEIYSKDHLLENLKHL